MASGHRGLTWKRTAIGGKYFATWNANKRLTIDGTIHNIHGTIERRSDGSGGVVFTWEVESAGRARIGSGTERGSVATLAAARESANIAYSDWIDRQ